MEKGSSLLSQKRLMMALGSAPYLLTRRLAMAIWRTLSMQPHPESEVNLVVGRRGLMLL